MAASFLLLFVSLYLAQMGDKTQILTLLLATRKKKHFNLFVSVMAGFILAVAIATIVGAGIANLVSHRLLEMVSAAIFILLGTLIFIPQGKTGKPRLSLVNKILPVPILIFVTDMGDKTQVAIALFSTNYHPLLVFASAICALALDTFLMIYFSRLILKKINAKIIEKLAALTFLGVGAYLFANNF